jgi:hypothetical protein
MSGIVLDDTKALVGSRTPVGTPKLTNPHAAWADLVS